MPPDYSELTAAADSIWLLPGHKVAVSATASSGGMVYRAFPHGLMYGQRPSMAGFGLFMVSIALFMFFRQFIFGGPGIFSDLLSTARDGEWLFFITNAGLILLMLAAAPLLMLFCMGDLIGFRVDKSILFDRHAGKVHLFSDQSTPLAPRRYALVTVDWECARAAIHTPVTLVSSLSSVSIPKVGLRCSVPGLAPAASDDVELGDSVPLDKVQSLLDGWEHVRRFMEHEGPLFAGPHDKPNPAQAHPPLWRHMAAWPKAYNDLGSGLFEFGWKKKNPLYWLFGVAWLACMPLVVLMMPWAVFPWLSGLAKREPVWPAEVLASVGAPLLHAKDLDAWRDVIPDKANQDLQKP